MSAPAASSASVDVRVTSPYTVRIGSGLLASLDEPITSAGLRPTRTFVLSDEEVAPRYAERVIASLAPLGCPVSVFVVPAGEGSKVLGRYGAVLTAMAEAQLDRGSLLVALGGGVIGDLGGFAAATYMRGLPYLHAPTTLLAMVDSSVGGKTGINLAHGKNFVGAFWQPIAVVADTDTLATLPTAVRRQGGVELFKAGLLGDPDIVRAFGTGSEFGATVDAGGPALARLIARGVAVKARVVAGDPLEHGARATLNLGHTIGHAIESLSGHALPHGEAIAYGLLAAAEIGAGRGLMDWRADAHLLIRWVEPGPLPAVTADALLERVGRDKKQVGARRRFVLLERIGSALVLDDVSDNEITRAWQALQEVAR